MMSFVDFKSGSLQVKKEPENIDQRRKNMNKSDINHTDDKDDDEDEIVIKASPLKPHLRLQRSSTLVIKKSEGPLVLPETNPQ